MAACFTAALRILQEMLHRPLMRDVASPSANINACEKAKHWEDGLRLASTGRKALSLLQVILPEPSPTWLANSVSISACEKGKH